jgi:hypothetical protein
MEKLATKRNQLLFPTHYLIEKKQKSQLKKLKSLFVFTPEKTLFLLGFLHILFFKNSIKLLFISILGKIFVFTPDKT